VSLSFSNAFEFTNLLEVRELRKSSYGNNLIETISLTLEDGGSINEVQRLLVELFGQLVADQERADQEWAAEKERLDQEEARLREEIAHWEGVIAEEEAQLAALRALIETATHNLEQYEAQLVANQETEATLDAQRRTDEEEFQRSVEEHEAMVLALDAVIEELSNLIGSISGVGRPEHVDEIAQETRDREYAVAQAAGSFLQLSKTEITLFAQLATKADQDALLRLLNLLRDLRFSTQQSLQDDRQHEDASLEIYTQLKASLALDNENLNKNIVEQTANKVRYEEEAAKLEVQIAEHKAFLQSLRDNLEAVIREREEKHRIYLEEKAEREEEMRVIQTLQKIVEERLANMSGFLRERTGGF
jgi:chromosome segregation ATPase